MAQIKFVTPSRELSFMQLSLLIIGLKFEGKSGMLMTSPSKANSAHIAKDFLGIDRKCRVEKIQLAQWLQIVKDAAMASEGKEIDPQQLVKDSVTVVTGTIG